MIKKLSLVLFLFTTSYCAIAQSITMSSPNDKVRLEFSVDSKGAPHYKVWYKNKAVVEQSALGFEIQEVPDLKDNFKIIKIDTLHSNTTWNPRWGEVKTIRDDHVQLKITLEDKNSPSRQLIITFRIFDDGVGFRYEFPYQKDLHHFIIEDELTTINLTGNHKIWWMPGDFDTNEYNYITSRITDVAKKTKKRDGKIFTATPIEGAFVQTPLMAKSDEGLYISLHEAALIDYPCMDLKFDTTTFEAKATLAPDAVGNLAYMESPCTTPWRTIIVSDDASSDLF